MSDNDSALSVNNPQQNTVDMSQFWNTELITAEKAIALKAILLAEVPKEAIRSHLGNGGKTYKYVDHVWVTKMLRLTFGPLWSYEASEATIEEDGTATARGTLKIKIPMRDGTYMETVFSDYGSCQTPKGMSMANRKLAASSKALVRCAFRAFGVGQEFYDSVNDFLTPKMAWDLLIEQVDRQGDGMTREEFISHCKENNIDKEGLLDHFEELYEWIYKTAKAKKRGEVPEL